MMGGDRVRGLKSGLRLRAHAPRWTLNPRSRLFRVLAIVCMMVYTALPAEARSRRVSRTLQVDQSLSIYSHRCKLSVVSSAASRVVVGCSRKNSSFARKRPKRGSYLTPGQRATVHAQSCSLQVESASLKKVRINCVDSAPPSRSLGGVVSGLSGNVILQNNGGSSLSISSNGAFAFTGGLAPGSSYNVTVSTQPASQTCSVANGAGTVAENDITNVQVTCVANSTVLSLSVSNLALSVAGLTEYGVSGTPNSGVARVITVANTGSEAAQGLSVLLPTLPSGTVGGTTCGSTLAAGGSCAITITPGGTATSDGTAPCTAGTAPIAGSLDVSADNATAVSANIVVLGYGCIYQGGYVFAFDDTTPSSGSVGGKVLTTSDQAAPFPNGVIWSSNGSSGASADAVNDGIYGIDETSSTSVPSPSAGQVSGQAACDGALDGACNSGNIVVYYENFATNAPINLNFYAAGLCKQVISSYADWYLPAICELGYGTAGCGSSSTPALQNAQSSLVDFNSLDQLSGFYVSSSQSSALPSSAVWYQLFASGGGSFQAQSDKFERGGVRCARALTL